MYISSSPNVVDDDGYTPSNANGTIYPYFDSEAQVKRIVKRLWKKIEIFVKLNAGMFFFVSCLW